MHWLEDQKCEITYYCPDFISTPCSQPLSDIHTHNYHFSNKYTICNYSCCGLCWLLSDTLHLKLQTYCWPILEDILLISWINPRQNHLYWIYNTFLFGNFPTLVTSCNWLGTGLSTRVIVVSTVADFYIIIIHSLFDWVFNLPSGNIQRQKLILKFSLVSVGSHLFHLTMLWYSPISSWTTYP